MQKPIMHINHSILHCQSLELGLRILITYHKSMDGHYRKNTILCSVSSLHSPDLRACCLWTEDNENRLPAVINTCCLSLSRAGIKCGAQEAGLCTRCKKVWSWLLITWRNGASMRHRGTQWVEGQTEAERRRNLWTFSGRRKNSGLSCSGKVWAFFCLYFWNVG